MKKKIIIIATVVLILAAVAAGSIYYFVVIPNGNYVGKDAAREAAFAKLGVTAAEVKELDVDLEREDGYHYYEVSFTHGTTEYEYAVDAETCEIVNTKTESIFD